MGMSRYTYWSSKAIEMLLEVKDYECNKVVLPLEALFGLESIDAPVICHSSHIDPTGKELVVMSADKGLDAFALSEVMDDVHIRNFVWGEQYWFYKSAKKTQ